MQSEINIKVGNKPPKDYFGVVKSQMKDNNQQVSGLATEQQLLENKRMALQHISTFKQGPRK
jgi:hypothetical protein